MSEYPYHIYSSEKSFCLIRLQVGLDEKLCLAVSENNQGASEVKFQVESFLFI